MSRLPDGTHGAIQRRLVAATQPHGWPQTELPISEAGYIDFALWANCSNPIVWLAVAEVKPSVTVRSELRAALRQVDRYRGALTHFYGADSHVPCFVVAECVALTPAMEADARAAAVRVLTADEFCAPFEAAPSPALRRVRWGSKDPDLALEDVAGRLTPPVGISHPREPVTTERISARNAAVVEAFMAGRNLSEIAGELGLTRQRVDQILKASVPSYLLALVRQRRQARRRTRAALAVYGQRVAALTLCVACREPALGSLRTGNVAHLCDACAPYRTLLHNHVHGRRLNKLTGKGRWLVEGSETHRLVLQARESNPAVWAALPEEYRRQVETGDWRPDDHPVTRRSDLQRERVCEGCGDPAVNRFCSTSCYRASGLIGKSKAAA